MRVLWLKTKYLLFKVRIVFPHYHVIIILFITKYINAIKILYLTQVFFFFFGENKEIQRFKWFVSNAGVFSF